MSRARRPRGEASPGSRLRAAIMHMIPAPTLRRNQSGSTLQLAGVAALSRFPHARAALPSVALTPFARTGADYDLVGSKLPIADQRRHKNFQTDVNAPPSLLWANAMHPTKRVHVEKLRPVGSVNMTAGGFGPCFLPVVTGTLLAKAHCHSRRGNMSSKISFFAYAEAHPLVRDAIKGAPEKPTADGVTSKPWKNMNIIGFKLDNLVRERIYQADFLAGDIGMSWRTRVQTFSPLGNTKIRHLRPRCLPSTQLSI